MWDDPARAEELAPHYDTARRMLGAAVTPFETPADEVMKQVAVSLGAGETFERTPVGVWFGEDGVDPYFEGAGPLRNGCVRCGGCMVGCRHNAKNSLDRNYLYLAERLGADVLPDREVTLLRRDGDGWLVETARPGLAAETTRDVSRARGRARSRRARDAEAPSALRARRPARRRARAHELGGARRRLCEEHRRRLFERDRDRLLDSRSARRTSSRCAIRAART